MLPKGYKFENVSSAKLSQALEAGFKGRAAIQILTAKRRREYNEAPNLCLYCQSPLLISDDVKAGEVYWLKKKKFCNQSCGAKYNNGVLASKRVRKTRQCSECLSEYTGKKRKSGRCQWCVDTVKVSVLSSRKKEECRIQDIRSHARVLLFRVRKKQCEVCGYSIRVDCCHIKPVKDFSKDTLLSEINQLSNLKVLCPNHHAEFDLGILKF